MTISLIAFAVVLLITYWWSNAGAFSALLHLACVIVAGAVAFAVWEPASYPLLSSGFDGYARGTALIGTFIVALLVLRVLTDKLVPMNLSLPRAADVTVGAAFGAASGVLSVGILVISMGYFQSTVTIGDYTGWSRRSDVPTAPNFGSDNAPVATIASITAGFYEYLSWGSFTPWLGGGTLATHSPDLVRMSGSLNRDSYGEGLARVSMQPEAVGGLEFYGGVRVPLIGALNAPEEEAYAVSFTVSQDGFDGGGAQFVLTPSQVRIVGDSKGKEAATAHPLSWAQATNELPVGMFFFGAPSNVVTSVPARGEGTFALFFAKKDMDGQSPKYVELKGVRYALPKMKSAEDAMQALMGGGGAREKFQDPESTPIDPLVEFPDPTYAIGGTVINSNDKGGLVTDKSNFIIGGEQKFPRNTTAAVGADLRIRGFQVSADQRILRLDARAAAGGVRIFPDLNEWVRSAGAEAQDSRVAVIDSTGSKYYAVGLVEDDGQWVFVRSMGGRPLTLRDIPVQPMGSDKKLALHFRVPADVQIVGLVLSTPKEDRIVNTMNQKVPKRE
ncbi:MAG: CvpA family protein [Phycisphaerales bacterium]